MSLPDTEEKKTQQSQKSHLDEVSFNGPIVKILSKIHRGLSPDNEVLSLLDKFAKNTIVYLADYITTGESSEKLREVVSHALEGDIGRTLYKALEGVAKKGFGHPLTLSFSEAARMTETSNLIGLYTAASTEYLLEEILELAGNSATDNKRKVITMKDLDSVFEYDKELSALVKKIQKEK